MREWRDRLDELVARGREAHGDAAVREALAAALTAVDEQVGPLPLTPPVAVLGLQQCASGWVGVLVRPSGQTTLHLGSTIDGLVEHVRQQDVLGAIGLAPTAQGDHEIDAWVRSRPSVEVIMVDPDAAFSRIAEVHPSATGDRRALLAAVGVTVPPMYAGMGFEEVELLQACVSAWTVADRFR